jgi:AAA family ATP:ADP antiporter
MVGLLRLAVDVRADEVRAVVWSFGYFFSILAAYFILRPLREEMGIAGGVRNLEWLFTATFLTMLAVVPAFGWLVTRVPRRRFVPYAHGFFIVNILVFWVLLEGDVATRHVARLFFVWASVFNLFVVSLFWSFMADLFRSEQGTRLFGFIAAGGTLGTIAGSSITLLLAGSIGAANLLPISAALLAVGIVCVGRLQRATRGFKPDAATPDTSLGGGILAGITEAARSPYLLGICGFIALFTTTSTFLYFQQAHLVADAFADSDERTRVFAFINLAVSVLTVAVQLALTGRIVKWLGVGAAVSFLPLVTLVGFGLFALAPTVTMLVGFQIVRRVANFAVTRPGREMLFTVVTREQKYKSKNFIDTVVYRGGDAASGWAYAGLSKGMGLDMSTLAIVCMPVAALWMVLGWCLGLVRTRRAAVAPAVT